MHQFICREPALINMNDQRLTNLYGSVILNVDEYCFWVPLKFR